MKQSRFRPSKHSVAVIFLFLLLLIGYYPLSFVFADPPYDGGSGDGWGADVSVDASLGGPMINFSSLADQSFTVGDAATAASTITISQESDSGITAESDIRIRIPSELAMSWDSSDTSAVITDVAAYKVSSTVSYPDQKTLLITVTSDFIAGDAIVISGLTFTDFTGESQGKLGLDIYDLGYSQYFDIKSISINPEPPLGYIAGDGWAYALSRSRCLTPPEITQPAGCERWLVGSLQDISWSTDGFSGTTLKLQYSDDDFVSDINDIPGASLLSINEGSFSWEIPDSVCCMKVRFKDNDNPDVTEKSNQFKIVGAFDLTSPSGGEEWLTESTHNITWTSTGTIQIVDLEYSTDDFTTPVLIDSVTSADYWTGSEFSYSWVIPAVDDLGFTPENPSATFKIRISDFCDSSTNSVSDEFVISGPALTIISPSSGLEWPIGSEQAIIWNSLSTPSNKVKIYYSVDGGDYTIIPETSGGYEYSPGEGNSYIWTIPDESSNNVKIKVVDYLNVDVFDESEVFSIITPTVTIVEPNGGEEWIVGTKETITWTGEGEMANNFTLYYSTDSGTDGYPRTIYSGAVTKDGDNYSYEWTLPTHSQNINVPTAYARIKVVNLDYPDDTIAASEADFSICNGFTISSPAGGETWETAGEHEVRWTTKGTVENVKLEYSTDNFISDINTITSSVENSGSYTWVTPYYASTTDLRVRLSDASSGVTKKEVSNEITVMPISIAMVTPVSGQLTTTGDTLRVEWEVVLGASGIADTEEWRIEFSSRADFVSSTIIRDGAASKTGDNFYYDWLVPAGAVSDTLYLRVVSIDKPGVSDTSDSFTVRPEPAFFGFTAPVSTDKWTVGSTKDIIWVTDGTVSNNFKIECFAGGEYTTVYEEGATGTDQVVKSDGDEWYKDQWVYSWTVPEDFTPSESVQLRVTNLDNIEVIGLSDSFEISPAYISITSPDSSDVWVMGEDAAVTWTSYGYMPSDDFEIKYSVDGADFPDDNIIHSGTVSETDGVYSWTWTDIPEAAISDTAKIRVTNNSDAEITDETPVFQIIGQGILSVTSPNGGEEWVRGTTREIKWDSVGEALADKEITIEYSNDEFVDDIHTVTSSTANDGVYSWSLPDSVSNDVKIRVSEVGGEVSDESDAAFNIVDIPTVSITSPNGAEEWIAGAEYDIVWTSTGVVTEDIIITYSANGGSTYPNTIFDYTTDDYESAVVDSDGGTRHSLVWTVPLHLATTVRVRIEDKGIYHNPSAGYPVADASDSNFSIVAPLIDIIHPNGAEEWIAGTAHDITWTQTGAVGEDIILKYSIDGGNTYNGTIYDFSSSPADYAALVSENSGVYSYSWTMPDVVSSRVKLKIEAVASTAEDESTTNFAILLPSISISAPESGDTWAIYDTENIIWTEQGSVSDNLKLEYLKDGQDYYTIEDDTSSSATSYSWTITEADWQDKTSGAARIKITDLNSETTFGAGNIITAESADFKLNMPTFEIAAPVEALVSGNVYTIEWSDIGSYAAGGNVKIEYLVDDIVQTPAIAESTANDGSFDWTVPEVNSENIKLKITHVTYAFVTGYSSAFEIKGKIVITAPEPETKVFVSKSQVINWDTYGPIDNINIYYSSAGAEGPYTLLEDDYYNLGSYLWTIPDLVNSDHSPNNEVYFKIEDASDSSVYDTLKFTVSYYLITWRVRDEKQFYNPDYPEGDGRAFTALTLVTKDTSGTVYETVTGLTSPVSRYYYPDRMYSSTWSRDAYLDATVSNWTALSDGQEQTLVELSLAEVTKTITVYSSVEYNASLDTLSMSAWIQEEEILLVDYVTEAYIDIYSDSGELISSSDGAENATTTLDNNGVFWIKWTNVVKGGMLTSDTTYFAKITIMYQGGPYVGGESFEITEAMNLYTITEQVKSGGGLEEKIESEADQTQSSVTTAKESIESEVAAQTVTIQNEVASKAGETMELIGSEDLKDGETLASTLALESSSRILNQESTIRENDTLTIRYKTSSGLIPVIDVYGADGTQKLSAGEMVEIPLGSGIYGYDVTFKWGRGEHTIICKETTKGTFDGINIAVISTDLENISSTANMTMAQLADIDTEKIEMFSESIGSINKVINGMVGAVDELSQLSSKANELTRQSAGAIYSGLEVAVEKLKEINKGQGVKIEEMYDLSEGQAANVNYIKNKTLEIKALVELSQEILAQESDEPLVKSWLETE